MTFARRTLPNARESVVSESGSQDEISRKVSSGRDSMDNIAVMNVVVNFACCGLLLYSNGHLFSTTHRRLLKLLSLNGFDRFFLQVWQANVYRSSQQSLSRFT